MKKEPTALKSYKWIFLGVWFLYTLSLIARGDPYIPLAVSILIAVIPNGVIAGIWYLLYRKMAVGKSSVARWILLVITFPLGLILLSSSIDGYLSDEVAATTNEIGANEYTYPVPGPRSLVSTPILSSTSSALQPTSDVSSSASPLTDALVGSILDRGVDYIQRDDYDSAIETFDQAIELDPEFAFSYSSRGVAYYYKGDFDRAIADYIQAIERDPQCFTAYIGRAVIHDEMGDYDRAITDYNRAINLSPQEASAYVNRGLAYNNKGDYDQATVDLNRALELAPDPSFEQQMETLLEELQFNKTIEQNRYVSFEELYRDVPVSSTDQKDWEQWKNKYEGMQVKGKGRFSKLSAHPQEGKLYLIFTVFKKVNINEDIPTEIAFLVGDAYKITLGEDEGSYLLDDVKWIYAGDYYDFEGIVWGYSRFDTELVNTGYDNLIIIKGKLRGIT